MVKEDTSTGAGIIVDKEEGEVTPPLTEEALREEKKVAEEGMEREALKGKVPIHPALIRLPASVAGRLATEFTGYDGFTFTEQELNDLAEIWMQVGIMVPPLAQALIATSAMVGIKVGGYATWKKLGKPKKGEVK